MKSRASWLLSISLIAVLGGAVLLTGGGSGQREGILSSFGDVPTANAAGVETSKPSNIAGDKAWEVIGGPVKIGMERRPVEPPPAASMNRLPW